MKKILNKVLNSIKPTKEEEKAVSDKVNSILNNIKKGIKDVKVVLGGSGIKGTWLKEAHDADIFVCFNYNKYKDKSDKLSDILGKHLKKKFNVSRLHGSRDYFQINEKEFTFEIVPILEIKNASQAMNITDVSPLHAKWVNKHKKCRDDVRLLKQFCKANDIYGAESYIKGFSGYICEILTVYYGSFVNVLKNAAKWKKSVVIDVEKYYKSKEEVIRSLNKSKLQSPLIVIDPVQYDRNAGAAISIEKYELFKKKAKEFLKKPSEKFFEKEKFSLEKIKKKKGNLILLEVGALSGKVDIVGCKLVKALEFINKNLIKKDFKVLDYGWNWDKKVIFYFVVKKEKLSSTIIHGGPPLRAKDHIVIFKKKYKKTFVSKGFIKAKIKRKYTDSKLFVKELIKDKDVKTRVKKIKMI
jgi:tRNA nucleotidyltransferase (CCA-adding enzyme)